MEMCNCVQCAEEHFVTLVVLRTPSYDYECVERAFKENLVKGVSSEDVSKLSIIVLTSSSV